MSDQLAESSKELELELREELDLALGATRDAQRHRDAALETLADRELTITKFRELTHQLQEQCLQLQQRVQSTESIKTNVRGGQEKKSCNIMKNLNYLSSFSNSSTLNLLFRCWSTTRGDIRLPENIRRNSSANQGGRSGAASTRCRWGATPRSLFVVFYAPGILGPWWRSRRDIDTLIDTKNDAKNRNIDFASSREI